MELFRTYTKTGQYHPKKIVAGDVEAVGTYLDLSSTTGIEMNAKVPADTGEIFQVFFNEAELRRIVKTARDAGVDI